MRFILSLICLLTFTFASFAQQTLSLDEAIKISLQKNTSLISNENQLLSSESNLTAAYGNFLPDLNAYGNWDWRRSDNAGYTTTYNGLTVDVPASTNETRSYTVGVSSNIVLFDGLSNYATLSRSKNNLQSVKYAIEGKKQEVVFQTITLYYAVVEAEQLLKVAEEDVKQQQKNLETIEERNRLGAVTLADVYQQQVQLGNAELQVIRQKNSLETAKSSLLYYLGLDVLQKYQYSDTLTSKELNILDTNINTDFDRLQELVNQALQNRRDYLIRELNVESSYDDITIARSGYFPRLSGGLGYNTYSNSLNKLFESNTYSVGVTLSIPIFSKFTTSNSIQSAEVASMDAELQLQDTKRLIAQNLQKTFLDLEAAKKGLLVTQKNVKSAEENLKIEQEKYNVGSGKLLDVLIANTAFQTATTNYINAQFLYIRLSEELNYNLGILDYSQYE